MAKIILAILIAAILFGCSTNPQFEPSEIEREILKRVMIDLQESYGINRHDTNVVYLKCDSAFSDNKFIGYDIEVKFSHEIYANRTRERRTINVCNYFVGSKVYDYVELRNHKIDNTFLTK